MLNRPSRAFLAGVGAFLLSLGAARAETVDITVVNGHAPVFLWVKHLKETFIPTVNKELEGTGITVNWSEQYGGSLAKVGSELETLEAELAEVGVVPTLFEADKLPLHNITYVTPFTTPDPGLVLRVMDDLHAKVPALRTQWNEYNLEYLGGGFALDDYQMLTTFPVQAVADMDGHKLNTPGPTINWLKGTGAIGVGGNLSTYYNNIKTGVVEGTVTFATAAAPGKFVEVAPHITKVSFGAQYAGSVVANKNWYDAQPEALKKALRTAAAAYSEAYHEELLARIEGAYKTMAAAGGKVTDLPDAERRKWAQALPPLARTWAEEWDGKGIPASDVLSAYMEAMRAAGAQPLRDWDKE